MRRGSRSIRTSTLLLTLASLAAAPAAAQRTAAPQPATLQAATPTPRQIAARAHAALLMIRALDANGDTLGLGTGFVVSPDGRFVTNYHVIQEAARLSVKLLDGAEWRDVQLVAADPASDLALMQIPGARGLTALPMGSDAQMEVGDRVFVMGNPLGMGGTFSDGMVSGKRPLEGVAMLQISAPISSGSSGGPVMNERGEVIGVATMMVMGGQNLNMAVPVRYLSPMLAARAEPRPFSPAVLVSNPHAGLALVGDPDAPAPGEERRVREPRREVEDQLDVVRPMLQLRGFFPAFPFALGEAAQAQGGAHAFRLEAGVSYLITARCDAECHDVDLTLADAAGRVLRSDADGDDFPTVSFVPRETGTYNVGVKLAECAADTCAYGVAVYRRDPAITEKRASAQPGR
ncbi:MAG: S1C family serine protease [Longimicrobiaceae bacterium]